MRRAAVVLLVAGVTACARPDGGQALYDGCAACHGAQGQGKPALGGNPLAGLPAWYVESQLTRYRTGARGAHPDDAEGQRMRLAARQLLTDDEVAVVAAYVASLPRVEAPRTLEGGNPKAAEEWVPVCTGCHGAQWQGQQDVGAPPLVGQADWYLLKQLQKFNAGVRGAHPLDAKGAQMRPMARPLVDEQAMKNVLANVPAAGR